MRTFPILLAVILALVAPAAAAAQDDYAVSPRELLAQASEIENKDPKAAADIIRRALPELQNTEDAALNREAQTRLCMMTASFDPAAALPIAGQGLALARAAAGTPEDSAKCADHDFGRSGLLGATQYALSPDQRLPQ